LNERLQELREKKRKDEEREEIEREKNRVKGGKESIEARKILDQKQKERDAFVRDKEKREEQEARRRIKEKIEQDKRERAAKQQKEKDESQTSSTPATTSTPTPAPTPAKKEYTECAVQIRFPDGNVIKATFKPTDPIRTVHNHVSLLTGSERFSLLTTFPKKIYSPREAIIDSTTLQQAEMVPTGTFVVSNF